MMISSSVLVGLVEALKHKAAAVFLRQTGSGCSSPQASACDTDNGPTPALASDSMPSPCPIESRK
jgi:hypothetical protein